MPILSYTFYLFLLLSLHPLPSISSQRIIPVKDLNNITLTFGSCNAFHGDEDNKIFLRIAEQNPDVWIWLGDAAYVDLAGNPGEIPRFKYMGETVIKHRLNKAKYNPIYSHLRESTNVIGVWDDHDYGRNNAGKDFPYKQITQQLWLDFIDEPSDSPRRKREGIYESYYLGDETKIKIILLDVRYFKDEAPSYSSTGVDMLGESQWEWLENEFKENKAEYVVIGSGLQVLPDDRIFPESWFAASRERLIRLIQKHKVGGVILLSGDVHFTEIMKHPCKERVGYELYEFTSSGLTHYVATHVPYVDKIIARLYPETWNQLQDKHFERNFGLIRFSFGNAKNTVRLEARNFSGAVVLEKDIKGSDLGYNEKIVDNESTCEIDSSRYSRFFGHFQKAIMNGEPWIYMLLLSLICAIFLAGFIVSLPFIFLYRLYRCIARKQVSREKSKKE